MALQGWSHTIQEAEPFCNWINRTPDTSTSQTETHLKIRPEHRESEARISLLSTGQVPGVPNNLAPVPLLGPALFLYEFSYRCHGLGLGFRAWGAVIVARDACYRDYRSKKAVLPVLLSSRSALSVVLLLFFGFSLVLQLPCLLEYEPSCVFLSLSSAW